MESDLSALLKTVCPRSFPDVAPVNTPMPYVTFQHVGGPALRYYDNTPMDKRHSAMQINVWAKTRAECLLIARQIEDAMCSASVFNARPESEPIGNPEPDFARYGTVQDFTILAAR
jgi:hypothetical protein